MDKLQGFIVNEHTKRQLTQIKVRIESIMKFNEICEDDIKSMIENLALIKLLEADQKQDNFLKLHNGAVCLDCGRTVTEKEYSDGETDCHHVEIIPEEDYESLESQSKRAQEEEKINAENPARIISFRFDVIDAIGTKIDEIKTDAENKTEAKMIARDIAHSKYKGKKITLRIK